MDHSIEDELGQSAIVEIETADGQTSCRVDVPPGSPERPMTESQLVDKFLDCASHSARPLSTQNLRAAVERIFALESERDVSEVLALLSS